MSTTDERKVIPKEDVNNVVEMVSEVVVQLVTTDEPAVYGICSGDAAGGRTAGVLTAPGASA